MALGKKQKAHARFEKRNGPSNTLGKQIQHNAGSKMLSMPRVKAVRIDKDEWKTPLEKAQKKHRAEPTIERTKRHSPNPEPYTDILIDRSGSNYRQNLMR